jgi:hypothetical protein
LVARQPCFASAFLASHFALSLAKNKKTP